MPRQQILHQRGKYGGMICYVGLQVAGEMASAGLQRMMDGYKREKSCSDLKEPKGFVCVSTTGFAGGAPTPDLSGMRQHTCCICC